MQIVTANGRTITLSGKVAAIIRLVVEQQAEIDAVPFGSWTIHLHGKKVSASLTKSYRSIALDEPRG
jgi:hypothetical protein